MTCTAFNCTRPSHAQGLCNTHYRRQLRHGYVKPAYSDDREAWFWSHVDKSGGPDACWPWTAHIDGKGYGRIKIEYRDTGAHRQALEYALGRPLAPGKETAHNCNNPPCCNPSHLREATHAENMADITLRRNSGTQVSATQPSQADS